MRRTYWTLYYFIRYVWQPIDYGRISIRTAWEVALIFSEGKRMNQQRMFLYLALGCFFVAGVVSWWGWL